MKQILISIRPEWVAKILKGEKTIEIRKTAPKELPCVVYIYCTKNGEQISRGSLRGRLKPLNGKVVARFTLDGVFLIHDFLEGLEATEPTNRHITIYDENELLKESCLSKRQIEDYGGVYAWHISDLEIFDKPKDLEQFDYPNPSGIVNVSQRSIKGLPNKKHPPQSWCYVKELL